MLAHLGKDVRMELGCNGGGDGPAALSYCCWLREGGQVGQTGKEDETGGKSAYQWPVPNIGSSSSLSVRV